MRSLTENMVFLVSPNGAISDINQPDHAHAFHSPSSSEEEDFKRQHPLKSFPSPGAPHCLKEDGYQDDGSNSQVVQITPWSSCQDPSLDSPTIPVGDHS